MQNIRNVDLFQSGLSSRTISVAIHLALVCALFTTVTKTKAPGVVSMRLSVIDPLLRPYVPARATAGGGGGGGDASAIPVSKGQLPKPAARPFVPPIIVRQQPKLAIAPSIVTPPEMPLPQTDAPNWGDPLATFVVPSNGTGSAGGMGNGAGGGVGSGKGEGFGPGDGGGITGGVYRAGGGVSAPVPIYRPDPEYSDEARKAKYSGSVSLSIIVDADGRVRDIRVLSSPGMGLDEKAAEAVAKWRFRPGIRNGRPVAVRAVVDLNFRLL